MAGNTAISTTFDRVFSTTHPQVMPKVWDNITTDIPFVHYLAEAGRVRFVEGGSALDFNVFKELGNAVGYASGTSTLTPVSLDPVTRGRYVWKNIALPFKIPGPDLRRNQGPTQIADLMAVVVESVRASFAEALGGSAVGVWSTADETSELLYLERRYSSLLKASSIRPREYKQSAISNSALADSFAS